MTSVSDVSPLKSVSELSREWLEKVMTIKLEEKTTVKSWKVRTPDDRDGFLSEVHYVQVIINTKYFTGEKHLVLKMMPKAKDEMDMMNKGMLGEREIRFYKYTGSKEFINFCQNCKTELPVPDVYVSCINADSLTLVLNDLNTDGYRLTSPPSGNSFSQLKSVFYSLALVHAFGYVSIDKYGRDYFNLPFVDNLLDGFFSKGLNMLIDIYKGDSLSDTFRNLIPLQRQFISACYEYPFIDTLIHGDLWIGNVMLSSDDTKAKIFDWQFACIDNPVCDIAPLLLVSAEHSVFDDQLLEILSHYWSCFIGAVKINGGSISVSFEDLVNNLEKKWSYAFFFLANCVPVFLPAGKMHEERLRRSIAFLDKKGVFSSFLEANK